MKIVTIAPLTVIVELNPTDCIALAVACEQVSALDRGGLDTLDTTGAAFLAAALAAFAPDTHQERTIAHLWRMWAPLVFTGWRDGPTYGRLPVPPEYAD